MSKISQNNLKSNWGWNIPKVVDLMISLFPHLTINFNLWFLSIHVRWIGFSKNSLKSTIGLKKSKKSMLQIQP